jgi:hypothetical protein
LKLIKLEPSFHEAYDLFIKNCVASMIYHTLEYRGFLAQLLNAESEYWIVVDSDNTITGVLPLFFKEGEFGTICNSLPFYGSHGSILAMDNESAGLLKNKYIEITTGPEIASSTLVTNPLDTIAEINDLPHTYIDERIGQFTPIAYSENHAEQLMVSYHYKTRNMVRKAEKIGIQVTVNNDAISFLEETHNENMIAIGGKAKPSNFFSLFPECFGQGYKIYVASIDGEPIAALLLFYHNKTVEYYTPVIKEQHRDKQALSLLIYRAMTEASEQNYTLWNWGGTWKSQTGVYTFKKRWGTLDIPYFYYIFIGNKNIIKQSPEILLRNYPYFFVAPFHLLTNE